MERTMTTATPARTIDSMLEEVAARTVAAWSETAGVPLNASSVRHGAPPEDGADLEAIAVQLAGAVDGAIVLLLPQGTVEGVEGGAPGLAAAAGEAFAASLGAPVTVVGSATVDPAEVLAAGGLPITAEITGASGSFPMHWLLEPALVARLEDDPVSSSESPGVAPASFPDLDGGASGSSGGLRDLAVLADVEMEVTVELGRARLRVRDLLTLVEGSVVDLDRAADSEVSVYVNGTLIARGEVVVVDDDLGVRITEIVARP